MDSLKYKNKEVASINLKNILKLLLAILIFEIFISLCGRLHFIQDDAYISLEYAKNFAQGNGLVFNIGQRVEGFTSFLWISILTIPFMLNINPEIFAQVLSISFGVLNLILTYFLSRVIVGKYKNKDVNSYFHFVPVIMLMISGTFYYWAVSGMETTLYTFSCMLGVYYYLIRNKRIVYLYLSIIFLTLAFLTRQEAAIIIGIFILDFIIEQLRNNNYILNFKKLFSAKLIIFLSIFIIPTVIFILFRFSYFGYLFPNTFYAKTGITSDYLSAGLQYTGAFFEKYLLYGSIFILPIFLLIKREYREKIILLYAIIFSYIIYIIFVGGDVLAMHRFFIPTLPLIYVLFTRFLLYFLGWLSINFKNKILTVSIATLILFAVTLNIHLNSYDEAVKMSRKEQGLTYSMKSIALAMKNKKKIKGEQILIAASTVGALKYFSDCEVLDMLGLTDKYIAHNPSPIKAISEYNTGWKEKNYNVNYVLSQKPDYIIFSTGEKPSSFAERSLFTKQDFFKCYFVYPIFTDSTKFRRNMYKRYSQENILLREFMVQKNKNYSPSFVNLYNSFLNEINNGVHISHFEKIENTFNKLIKCSPSYFGEPYRFMAAIYHDKGDNSRSMEYLNKCIEIDSLNLYSRMLMYEISKDENIKTVTERQVNYIKNYFPWFFNKYKFMFNKEF